VPGCNGDARGSPALRINKRHFHIRKKDMERGMAG
jgi:hypothetical protein